jgi:hypothetical protein
MKKLINKAVGELLFFARHKIMATGDTKVTDSCFMFKTDTKSHNSRSTSWQYYVCNTMLLTTSAVAFRALLTTNLETVLRDKNCTHSCQGIVLKAATK